MKTRLKNHKERILGWATLPKYHVWSSLEASTPKGVCARLRWASRPGAECSSAQLPSMAQGRSLLRVSPREPGRPWLMDSFPSPPILSMFLDLLIQLQISTLLCPAPGSWARPGAWGVARREENHQLPRALCSENSSLKICPQGNEASALLHSGCL